MKVAVIGVAAGLVGAFLASKLLQRLLYGVSPTDARRSPVSRSCSSASGSSRRISRRAAPPAWIPS